MERKVTEIETASAVLSYAGFVALPLLISFAIYMSVRKR
jgi:hypothetical protein